MADKKSEIETDSPDQVPQSDRVDVLTNAVRRLDNRFRGRPNDSSLIGEDLPEEEEEEDDADDRDEDQADDPDKDEDWPEPKGTKLW